MKNVRVVCVSPVALCRRAGCFLRGDRRVSLSGFSTTSSSSAQSGTLTRHHASRHHHFRHHARSIALRARRGAIAAALGDTFASYDPNAMRRIADYSPAPASECVTQRVGAHASPSSRAALPTAGRRRPEANVGGVANSGRAAAASAAVRPRVRGAPLSRRQSDRPRQPVVRALHEHGAAEHRPSRHRLRHGELVRALRHARFRSAGRRHRGDVARPQRRPCRHHHRHRCAGQSDHDLRQQRQPRPRGAGLARPHLCLCDAGELEISSGLLRPQRCRRRQCCRRRSPRHRCRNRRGRAGAAAPAGWRGRVRRYRDRH